MQSTDTFCSFLGLPASMTTSAVAHAQFISDPGDIIHVGSYYRSTLWYNYACFYQCKFEVFLQVTGDIPKQARAMLTNCCNVAVLFAWQKLQCALCIIFKLLLQWKMMWWLGCNAVWVLGISVWSTSKAGLLRCNPHTNLGRHLYPFVSMRCEKVSVVDVCDILSMMLPTFRNSLGVTGSHSIRWQPTFTGEYGGDQHCWV